ncbi:MAG: CopD family protein [Pirellulaceae bacterium]
MATNAQQPDLSSNIRGLLAGLRWRIRAYVLFEGVLLAIVWLTLTFIAEVAIDYGLVVVGATELPVAVRFLALVVIAGVLAYILYRWILRRTFVRLADHSMAVLLERRFVDFHDSLVTAVEMAEHPDHAEQFNHDMLDHTTDEAQTQVGKVRLSRVFNLAPLMFSFVLAIVLAVPIGLYAGFFPNHFLLGASRVYLLSDEPWPRLAQIEVLGIDVLHASMRTGEVDTQHLKFKDGVVRVAKGANVELQVLAHGDNKKKPEVVELYYATDEVRDRVPMTRMPAGEIDDLHIYSEKPLHGIVSDITFDVRGGDHRLSGFRIEVVETPQVKGAEYDCVYPPYMVDEALSQNLPRTVQHIPGAHVPIGASLTVRAEATKPLKDAEIKHGQTGELLAPIVYRQVPMLDGKTGDTVYVTIALPPLRKQVEYDRPGFDKKTLDIVPIDFDEPVKVFNRKTGQRIAVRADMLVKEGDKYKVAEDGQKTPLNPMYLLVNADTGGESKIESPVPVSVEIPQLKKRVDGVLHPEVNHKPRVEVKIDSLQEDLMLDITLTDEDDVRSQDPYRMFIAAAPDAPPDVNVTLRGIGTLITPIARIPLVGEVSDDYGVAKAWVETQLGETRTLRDDAVIGKGGEIKAEIDFRDKSQDKEDRVVLVPEDLVVVTVKAEDRYDLADDPNVGMGDRYQLKVVTEEQLLAYLARQEQTMREILEHARDEMQREHDALIRSKSDDALGGGELLEPEAEPTAEPDDAEPGDAEPGDAPSADTRSPAEKVRARRLLRVQQVMLQSSKSRQEIRGVAEGFASIREEHINNRTDSVDHQKRLQDEVYVPLLEITEELFSELDRQLKEDLEPRLDDPDGYVAAADQSIVQIEDILLRIDGVLEKLQKFEDINRLIEIVRRMIDQQENLTEETKSEQTKRVLQELQDLSN